MEDFVNDNQLGVSDTANNENHQSEQKSQPLAVVAAATGVPNGTDDDDNPSKRRRKFESSVDMNIYNVNRYEEDFFDRLPPGLRFCPYDTELITSYLTPKVFGGPLPCSRIVDVKLYKHNPEYLAEKYREFGEKEWYFFTPRNRKYRNGDRPNRAAGDGYWKATGADKPIKTTQGHTIGSRKALVFYKGKAPHGVKTNWIMHEYRVSDPPEYKKIETQKKNKINDDDSDDDDDPSMGLDNWVLCRIYKKSDKRIKSRNDGNDDPTPAPRFDHYYHQQQQQPEEYDHQLQQGNYQYLVKNVSNCDNNYGGHRMPSITNASPSAMYNIVPHNSNSENYSMDVSYSGYIDDISGMNGNSFFAGVCQFDQQMHFSTNYENFSSHDYQSRQDHC